MGQKEELKNTIRAGTEMEYELPEQGVQIMGIIKIKNIILPPFDGKGEPRDGYRVVFRSIINNKAFAFLRFSSSTGKRADLFKFISGCGYKGNSPDIAFKFLESLIGKWYKVEIEYSEDGNYANIAKTKKGFRVVEDEASFKKYGDCRDYFKAEWEASKDKPPAIASEVEVEGADFSSMPDIEEDEELNIDTDEIPC